MTHLLKVFRRPVTAGGWIKVPIDVTIELKVASQESEVVFADIFRSS
jgi:hypothetical protein